MITHQRLVETVASEAGLRTPEEATHIANTVLADLSLRLDMPRRRRLRQALPPADRDAAYAVVPPRGGGVQEFLHDIGEHLGTPPERARFLAQTVLSAVRESDTELVDDLSPHLPPDIAELFNEPPGEPERRNARTLAPAPLTEEELATALRDRPAWTGDTRRIHRTVGLPQDRIRPLLHRIEAATRDMQHRCHPRIGDGEVTFTLYTRSVDAVTDADLRLADAIDATIDAFGSGG